MPNWIIIVLILCVIALIAHRIGTVIVTKRRKAKDKNAYVRGLASLVDGKLDNALSSFRQAVREEPHNIEAYLRLGDVLRETNDVSRAIQIHRELTVRPGVSKDDIARVMLSLARDYSKAKRFDRAAATYENLLKVRPNDETALTELLDVYEEMDEWDKAYGVRRTLSRIRKVDDTHSLALYKAHVGKRFLDKDLLKEAESNLKDALKIDSECVPAYLYLGDLYYRQGKLDDAISSWRRIVTMFPEVAYITFRRLEKAFYEKGTIEKILDLYNDVLERNPRDVRTLMTLANIYRKKGNIEDAIRLCRTALEFDPDSRRVKQALARLYYEKGDIEQSLKTMVEAFNGFSSDEEVYTCRNCNYKASEVLWRCPRCKEWETFV